MNSLQFLISYYLFISRYIIIILLLIKTYGATVQAGLLSLHQQVKVKM